MIAEAGAESVGGGAGYIAERDPAEREVRAEILGKDQGACQGLQTVDVATHGEDEDSADGAGVRGPHVAQP